MSVLREPVIPHGRTRGVLLPLALAAALGAVLLAGTEPGGAAAAAAGGAAHAKAAPARKPARGGAVAQAKAAPDSLTRLEAAVRRDSTDARARYRLGIAYLDRDNPGEAALQFQRAVALKPDYVEAWVNLGAAEDANGHGSMARSDYRRALSLRANDEIAMCRMASSFYAGGMKDSAMGVIRDILKVNDKSSCAYFTLGVSFADANMFREAIRVWQKVVDLAPKSPEAESATESIKLLKDYLGPQGMMAAAPAGAPGIALGSGGPEVAIPGGEMGGPKFLASPAGGAAPAGGEKKDKPKGENPVTGK